MQSLGLVHMGSQVPSPTHVSKSRHGDKVTTFEPQESIKIGFCLLCAKTIAGLVSKVGSNFLAPPNPTTQVPSLTFKKCCHVGISVILGNSGLGTPCGVVSPNVHALNGWDCTDWPQVTWGLGLGTRVNGPFGTTSKRIQGQVGWPTPAKGKVMYPPSKSSRPSIARSRARPRSSPRTEGNGSGWNTGRPIPSLALDEDEDEEKYY